MEQKESRILTKWRTSSGISGFLGSFLVTIIITFTAMTVSFIKMLFSSGNDGKRFCFFKTIFFESVTKSNGNTNMSFGMTGEYIPILFFMGVCFLFLYSTYLFAKWLLQYRQRLIEQNEKRWK